jgi:hypothetical protein
MLRLGRPGHVWIAKCFSCGRKSLLPVERILERFGEHMSLPRAATRLKCEGCGRLGAAVYLGELPEPGGDRS